MGLGGVGKSQLAIEYAHWITAGHFDRWVFWVHAGTQARVEEGFRTIANAVKLPGWNQPKADIPQLVYCWLSNERNGRWIMILDSADDRNVFCSSDDVDDEFPPIHMLLGRLTQVIDLTGEDPLLGQPESLCQQLMAETGGHFQGIADILSQLVS